MASDLLMHLTSSFEDSALYWILWFILVIHAVKIVVVVSELLSEVLAICWENFASNCYDGYYFEFWH